MVFIDEKKYFQENNLCFFIIEEILAIHIRVVILISTNIILCVGYRK